MFEFEDEWHRAILARCPSYPHNVRTVVSLCCFFGEKYALLECGPMPNVMAALANIGGAVSSTPQILADAHCWSAVQ